MQNELTEVTAPVKEGTAADQDTEQAVQTAEGTETEKDLLRSLEEQRRQLEKEKKELELSYLRLDTKQLLKENGLPEILADYVMASDFAETKAIVAEIRTAFDDAVQKRVIERMAGRTPQGGTGAYHSMDNIAEQVKRSLA